MNVYAVTKKDIVLGLWRSIFMLVGEEPCIPSFQFVGHSAPMLALNVVLANEDMVFAYGVGIWEY
jgi:hypothetical protein